MANDELISAAARELRHLDRRFRFWVDLGVAEAEDSGASAEDLDWAAFDWPSLHVELEAWLDQLPDDEPEATKAWPINDSFVLVFVATRRDKDAVGYRRMPSFKLSKADPFPPLNFADGDTGSLESLTMTTVRELASGQRSLAIALLSHREAWQMLSEQMQAQNLSSTSEMLGIDLEVCAAMLGLVEPIAGPLGDFDEGWRAIHGAEAPIVDDPRRDG